MFIVVFILVIILFMTHWNVRKVDTIGYHVMDMFTREEVDRLLRMTKEKKYEDVYAYITTHPRVLQNVHGVIGDAYRFQNYLLSIEKSSVSTCHRDENGQFFNRNLKHPSYTMLFYLKELNGCLDIIENSHVHESLLNTKKLKTIDCVPGQAILFDADMIHSGTSHDVDDSTRIQLKLHHKDDHFPEYLENMKQRLDASKNEGSSADLMRSLSCTFPIISDLSKNGQHVPEFITRIYKDIAYGKGKYEMDRQ